MISSRFTLFSSFYRNLFSTIRPNCWLNRIFRRLRVDLRYFLACISFGSQDICKMMAKSSSVVLGRFNRFPDFYHLRLAKYNQLIAKSACLHDFQSNHASSEFLSHLFCTIRWNCWLNRVFPPLRVDL